MGQNLQIDKVTLLSEVLLCDLQLHRHGSFDEMREQRTDGFADLKVDRTWEALVSRNREVRRRKVSRLLLDHQGVLETPS